MFISSVFVVLFAGTVDWQKPSETLHCPPICDHCAVQSGDKLQLLTLLEEKTDFHTIEPVSSKVNHLRGTRFEEKRKQRF